jgi:hypothetical protein
VDLQGSGTKCWLQPRIAEAVGERAREPKSADCWPESGRVLGESGQKAVLDVWDAVVQTHKIFGFVHKRIAVA